MLLCLLMHIACKTAVTRASSKLQSSLMRTPGGNTTQAAHSESHKLKDLWVCVYVHILAACLIWTHSIGWGGGGRVFSVDHMDRVLPDTGSQGYANNVKNAHCSKNVKQPCAYTYIQLSAKSDKIPSKAELTLKDNHVRILSAQAVTDSVSLWSPGLTVWVEVK